MASKRDLSHWGEFLISMFWMRAAVNRGQSLGSFIWMEKGVLAAVFMVLVGNFTRGLRGFNLRFKIAAISRAIP